MEQPKKKITIKTLLSMKESKVPASFITAYDYPSSVFINDAGIDMILVGDSGGMTTLGYKNTMPVTMDEMLHFTKAVLRGNKHSFVVGDMPFMSYQASNKEAVKNAGRFMQAGCDAVKLEVSSNRMAERLRAISEAGIAVMAHIGLTPQSLSLHGAYRICGKGLDEIVALIQAAKDCQRFGADFILLEAIPERSAEIIKQRVEVPVYGIGCGLKLDGQLLILHDALGMFVGDIKPRFAKQYEQLGQKAREALGSYHKEVKEGLFPSEDYCYLLSSEELDLIERGVKSGYI